MALPHITLKSCPKGYTRDLDKTSSPADTVKRVTEKLKSLNLDILRDTRRVDVGRLGIPVYLSICGEDARRLMPTRNRWAKAPPPNRLRLRLSWN